jgi:hypothetical protein
MKKNISSEVQDLEQTQEREGSVPPPGTKEIPTNSQAIRNLRLESEREKAGRNERIEKETNDRESNSENSEGETNY